MSLDFLDSVMLYYLWLFVGVGVVLVYILAHNVVMSLRAFPAAAWAAKIFAMVQIAYSAAIVYLAAAMVISYIRLAGRGWHAENFTDPYAAWIHEYVQLHIPGPYHVLLLMAGLGTALASLIFLINGPIKLLKSSRRRLKGWGHFSVALGLSLLVVVTFLTNLNTIE